jgi:hypothetical protein
VQAAIAIDHAVGDLSARLAASGPKSRP